MIADPIIVNPLSNPVFVPTISRMLLVYLIGFFLILALHRFNFKGLWGSNVGKRYLSWLVIGPLYLFIILLGGDLSLLFLIVVLLLALREAVVSAKLPKMYSWTLAFLAIGSVYVTSYQTQYFYSLPLVYFMIISMVALRENDAKRSFPHASTTLFLAIWLIFSLCHFILLGHLNNGIDQTKGLLLLLGFAVPLSDVMAYVVGRAFQRFPRLDSFKIASNLSPKKSYAGVLGNILGAAIGIWIMFFAIGHYVPPWHWLVIAFLIGIMGVIGDITESMFKRYVSIKDSGNLLPGHGGVLDRIDSTLRVIVVLFYYLVLVL